MSLALNKKARPAGDEGSSRRQTEFLGHCDMGRLSAHGGEVPHCGRHAPQSEYRSRRENMLIISMGGNTSSRYLALP